MTRLGRLSGKDNIDSSHKNAILRVGRQDTEEYLRYLAFASLVRCAERGSSCRIDNIDGQILNEIRLEKDKFIIRDFSCLLRQCRVFRENQF